VPSLVSKRYSCSSGTHGNAWRLPRKRRVAAGELLLLGAQFGVGGRPLLAHPNLVRCH
jgi:hypothetical protein